MNTFKIVGTDFVGQLEKTLTVEKNKVFGFDAQKEPVMLSAGGGGTGSFGGVYEGRAPLPPDDPTAGALNYPLGGGSMQQWSVVAQDWV